MKGLVIAAPSSGSGKTLVTLALLRAFKNMNLQVASAKVGPDYIDPAFHTAASGQPCRNLDPWAMAPEARSRILNRLAGQSDLILTEGVMGLYDGARDGTGSTADLAVDLNWPILLVVDVRGQATSAVATVKGFLEFRSDLQFAGVIFNRTGGVTHQDMLKQAMARHLPQLRVLGCLPKQADLVMPERHLGLVQAGEHQELEIFLDRAADWVSSHLDLELLAGYAGACQENLQESARNSVPPLGQRIAVARDQAFAFSYESMLEGWRDAGAEIHLFSPLQDEGPDEHSDAVYLPGGYPELHAGLLSGNEAFRSAMRAAANRNAFIFGECGGYMTLGTGLVDAEGQRHKMLDLLPLETSFEKRRLHLGYRKAVSLQETPLGSIGSKWRGHEFHYASILEEGDAEPLFEITDALDSNRQQAGLRSNSVAGSFLHLIDRAHDKDG